MKKSEISTNETRYDVTFNKEEVINILKAEIMKKYPEIGKCLQGIRPYIRGLENTTFAGGQPEGLNIYWVVDNER